MKVRYTKCYLSSIMMFGAYCVGKVSYLCERPLTSKFQCRTLYVSVVNT